MAGHKLEECLAVVWSHVLEELRRVVHEELIAQSKASPPPLSQQLTVAQAGQIASRCPDSIRHAIKHGKLKASKPGGSRQWLIQAAELRRWLGGNKGEGVPLDLETEINKAVAKALQ